MPKPESLRTILLAVASTAVDLPVRTVALQCRVQGAVAVAAIVALLVPHRATRQLLLSRKHSALASRATSSFGGRNRGGVWRCSWSAIYHVLLAEWELLQCQCRAVKSSYSRNIRLKKSGATGESIAMRPPSLAVARLAVDVLIRPIAGDNRVQGLCAVVALVALAMPIASL